MADTKKGRSSKRSGSSSQKTASRGKTGKQRKGQRKIREVMREYKRGTLRSSSGRKVRSRKQAVAIALNEAREAGAKIPPPKRSRRGRSRKT